MDCKMSITYITVYLTVLMEQLLTSQAQFLPQIPFSFPQGMPQQPMQMPENPSMPGMPQMSGMPQMPGMQPMPMAMPGHMPMPMHFPMSQPRLPVVVMPYYSKNSNKPAPKFRIKPKKHTKKKYLYQESESCDTSDESNTSSGEYNFRKMGRNGKVKKSRQVLTPVVSYVTKDGYVVYQKKIKKDRAKDWLEIGNRKSQSNMLDAEHFKEESGERFKDVKRRLKLDKKRSHRY